MNETVKIRKASCIDALSLFELNEKFNGSTDITVEQIESSLIANDREEVFVAEIDDILVGFCCVQVFKSFCYNVDYAEITEIYIDEEYQHQSIGTKLLRYVELYFEQRGINNFQLFTGEKNYSAQSFYEKLGYKKTAEIMYRKRKQY